MTNTKTHSNYWFRQIQCFLLIGAALLFLPNAEAQEKPTAKAPKPLPIKLKKPSIYQAMGAPSNPKVDVHWNRFNDYAATTKILKSMVKEFPNLAKLQSLGKSYGKREMWVITITNFKKGDVKRKPAFWIDGGIHANEVQAVEVPMYTAWFLLESYGRNEFITNLLDNRMFYIMPMMSPDSRDAHFHEPNTTHSPRTGQRPIDDDRDGLVDEDKPDDLDGDGSITQMRIRDKNGRYKAHEKYPNLMVRVAAGEKGEYTLLGTEGIDNDGDGQVNEDGDGVYDPNRDWAWNWQPKYIQRGAYRYPFSIKENRMVADFITKQTNIAGAQSYHNTGGMILRGPGVKSDRFDRADIAFYKDVATKGERILPGYKSMNIADELYEVYGGEVDWLHMMRGIYTFTNELFTPYNFFRQVNQSGFFGSREQQHEFNKLLLFGQGIKPWKKVKHPQYGEVEVGGMKKNWVRQPPSFLLEEECHRNTAFTLYHADQMPLVKVQSVTTKDLGDGLTEVTAVVENLRMTPTHNAADVKNKITRPDLVTITGKDLQVIVGMTGNNKLFTRKSEQKRDPHSIRLPRIEGHAIKYIRWIVKGPGPYTVTIDSIKGGIDAREVKK